MLRQRLHSKWAQFHRPARPRLQTSFHTRAFSDSSTQANQKPLKGSVLSSNDLHRAAQLARLSGLCYYPPDQLEARLRKEGLSLVTSGNTPFTRWYIADGPLNSEYAGRAISLENGEGPSGSELHNAPQPRDSDSNIDTERIFMLRGVVWRGEGVDSFRLWQDLVRFWPSAFAKEHTKPPGVLLAHAGAADMAERLYETLKIAVEEGIALNRRMTFGGHSLGGSLSLLLSSLFKLRLNIPAPLIKVTTFGSPPVLSHKNSRGGEGILQVLGLKRSAIRSYVLENDPVPRALLSIDPTFTALKNNRAGSAFLQLRQLFMGSTALTPDRFLADNVGEVHLIKWTAEEGHEVIALAPEEIEAELLRAAGGAASSFQRVVDHAHGSYSTDLDAAAWQLQTKGM